MKIRNIKLQSIKRTTETLALRSHIRADIFQLISIRLNESLYTEGFNLETIGDKQYHCIEMSLFDLYECLPQHPESTLRSAFRSLHECGLIFLKERYVIGQNRIISTEDFMIEMQTPATDSVKS